MQSYATKNLPPAIKHTIYIKHTKINKNVFFFCKDSSQITPIFFTKYTCRKRRF